MRANPGDRVSYTYNEKNYLGTVQNTSDEGNTATVSLPGEGMCVKTQNNFSAVYDGVDTLSIQITEDADIHMDVQNRTLVISAE